MNDQVRAAIARSKAVRFDGDVRELFRVAHGDRRVLARENERLRKLLIDLVEAACNYGKSGPCRPSYGETIVRMNAAIAAVKEVLT